MITTGEVLAIIALLNGMLGGTILVLPLIAIKTGYLLIPIITILYGVLSGYSTYLIALHLGKAHSIRAAILEHFYGQRRYSNIYCFVIFISFFFVLITYFQLFIKQIEGFLHPSVWIGIISAFSLIGLTFLMRKFKIGDKLLAYGIISIIVYIIFLFWAQVTAPSGEKQISPAELTFVDLAASLTMAFAVQSLVDEVLLKNTTPDKYSRCILIMTIIGISAYLFISYGSYGKFKANIAIINRKPRVAVPQTVEEYFPFGSW